MSFDSFGARVTPTVYRKRITTSFVRPSDTTAYAAGDVVGPVTTPAVQSFAGAARYNGGSGRIVELLFTVDLELVTNGTFRFHWFNTTLTPQADNAAFTGLSTNPSTYLGYIDPPILVTQAGGTLAQIRVAPGVSATGGLPFSFQCASGDTGLYLVITALAAYTPKSAGIMRVSIVVEQD